MHIRLFKKQILIIYILSIIQSNVIQCIESTAIPLTTITLLCGGYLAGKCIEIAGSYVTSKPENRAITMNVTHNTITTSGAHNHIGLTLPAQESHRGTQGTMHGSFELKNFLKNIYSIPANNYGTATLVCAGLGYAYLMYTLSRMQKYLMAPERISHWFREYDFNTLLLLEPSKMHELMIQEFLTTYHIHDQKNLKNGIHEFIENLSKELTLLKEYQTLIERIDKVSSVSKTCGSTCGYVLRSCVPLSGIVLNYAPSFDIHGLFFINNALKNSINERISRLHYYKNVFLQSPIIL